jgi:pimeloyl-ACP methyl ester carboxylesterase
MRHQGILTAMLTAVTAAGLIAYAPTSAAAATSSLSFTTCAGAPNFGCGHLTVPLDPTGAIPGTVALAIRRELSATGAATEAVVALAGGPGQAALPFANDAAQIMSKALATRDLVVFDQRGTGDSGALKCAALGFVSEPLSTVIPDCATQIGVTRGLYTTDNTVADIEAMRKALGYTKLVLYGTSYGTKVALRYAGEFPSNVAGLILDSTVSANGPDIFGQSTYAAVPRILGQICTTGACPGIPNPLAELHKVLTRLNRGPVKATYVDGHGVAVPLKIDAEELVAILLAGDEDPSLRADFPAAVAAAAGGDYALLAILVAHALLGSVSNATIDSPLFFASKCEELPFPWPRSDPTAERIAAAIAAAKALPAGTFGPFSYLTAYHQNESSAADCAYWPFLSAAPEATITALPNVPTLIISGADDLRTPTADARAVAALIPDATVVVVPQTGHSALTTEFGSCATDAVDAFFEGTAIKTTCPSRSVPAYLRPAPAAPASLRKLRPLGGTHGIAGRTEKAFELTLGWSTRELSESLFETLIGSFNPSFNHGLGGLHGGYAKQTTSKTTLKVTISYHHFSYVPGVTITGSITNGVGTLTVGGPLAAAGRLVATKFNQFSGRLGGVAVHLRISRAHTLALTTSLGR